MPLNQSHQQYNTKFFKRFAPVYDHIEILMGRLRNKVVDKITKPNTKILDIACGTGAQSIAFAKKGHSVIGIDLSEDMLKRAQEKIKPEYDIKFILGDATKLDYPDNTFDASSVSLALHDTPEEIAIMILQEMKRTTKNDGQIIIVDYNTPKNWWGHQIVRLWESKYYDHFMKMGLKHYLDKVGLTTIHKSTYLLGNFQMVECENKKTN